MHTHYEEIKAYVDSLYIVDTHEHLLGRETYFADPKTRCAGWDVLNEYLQHYICSDLRSAGLSPADLAKLRDITIPIEQRWAIVEPYWQYVRHTGYCRALDIAVRDIYDLPGINQDTILTLNRAFQASFHPGKYEEVLKKKSKIRISLLDSDLDCDQRFFRSVFRLESFISPQCWEDVQSIEAGCGQSIVCFSDWLLACKAAIEDAIRRGAVAFKTAIAYNRTLLVNRTSYGDAEQAFNSFFGVLRLPTWSSKSLYVPKAFEDYMIHFILGEIAKHTIPIQIHTGIQEGNGNMLADSNPTLLSNLFLEYPMIRFDIFHMGYPYQLELSALAKMFPNVFIDMCWGHIISPIAAQNALVEWIDTVPINKISAFGGDYSLVDGVYGHQAIARENISISLSAKVAADIFDVEEAKRIAKLLFIDNPISLFGLKDIAD